MRANHIVVPSPTLDDDLGLAQGVEDLAIEKLVAQPRIKAFDVSVLPRTARGNVGGLCADSADPILHGFGDELRAVVGTNVLGNPAQDEQVRQYVDDVERFEPAGYPNGQALVGKLVDEVEHAELASIMSALLEEVVRPNMVGAFGSETNARSVIQPQTS